MKIFGREPVLILAFISVALKLSAAYGLDLSEGEQGALMALLSVGVTVVEAIVLRNGAAAAAIINLGHAALALFLAFGLDLPPETQALWILGIESVVSIFVRREVTAPVVSLPIENRSPASLTKAA